MEIVIKALGDALFAGIAAIGFSAISKPPRQAYLWCALIAACGHSMRFLLMQISAINMHIVAATTLAALLIGVMSVLLSPMTKVPAETYLFPSLLPMIPGVYAYKTFGGLVMTLVNTGDQEAFHHYFYLFASNGLTCFFILLGMAIGATIPIFLLKRISFQATRNADTSPSPKRRIRF